MADKYFPDIAERAVLRDSIEVFNQIVENNSKGFIQKLDFNNVIENFGTRQDFTSFLRRIESITPSSATPYRGKDGIMRTKFMDETIKTYVANVNRQKARRLDLYNELTKDRKLTVEADVEKEYLKRKKSSVFIGQHKQQNYKQAFRQAMNPMSATRRADLQLKENFLRAAQFSGMDDEQLDIITERIKNMSASKFYKFYVSGDLTLTFFYLGEGTDEKSSEASRLASRLLAAGEISHEEYDKYF